MWVGFVCVRIFDPGRPSEARQHFGGGLAVHGPPHLSELSASQVSLSFRGATATRNLLFAGASTKQVPPLRFAHHRNDKALECQVWLRLILIPARTPGSTSWARLCCCGARPSVGAWSTCRFSATAGSSSRPDISSNAPSR